MDSYILNKHTGRVTKIASKAYKRHLLSNIRQNTKNTTPLTNISYEDSQKLKDSLPKLTQDKFYCYDTVNQNIITKNKSLKCSELIRYM